MSRHQRRRPTSSVVTLRWCPAPTDRRQGRVGCPTRCEGSGPPAAPRFGRAENSRGHRCRPRRGAAVNRTNSAEVTGSCPHRATVGPRPDACTVGCRSSRWCSAERPQACPHSMAAAQVHQSAWPRGRIGGDPPTSPGRRLGQRRPQAAAAAASGSSTGEVKQPGLWQRARVSREVISTRCPPTPRGNTSVDLVGVADVVQHQQHRPARGGALVEQLVVGGGLVGLGGRDLLARARRGRATGRRRAGPGRPPRPGPGRSRSDPQPPRRRGTSPGRWRRGRPPGRVRSCPPRGPRLPPRPPHTGRGGVALRG